ncbi:uncharacterized protein LOC124448037 isoform X3 [Xenia sp. Carnegie-2017]|uniref:uncharacterized protein LOC124448037 isoform X3 n=1 Tax=Xenia sp. Carnegie-2017 TaxID=2897299 RepID=UPI001F04E5F2|nr:uncharacterized protein LOC124448037 isoform X3 [Xenia sp. Carnegie-2017]
MKDLRESILKEKELHWHLKVRNVHSLKHHHCTQSWMKHLWLIKLDAVQSIQLKGLVKTAQQIKANFNENSNMSDDVFDNPSQNEAEVYPKPLPLPPVDPPKVDLPTPVLCETYTLDVTPREKCFNNLVNRPLPQTPKNAFPPENYSAVSLDRSLLKRQREARLNKTETARTLPRPYKIRQISRPLINALTRSTSNTDVSKETSRLSDHVASDPNQCTLTRVKKRTSQSLDTLLQSERVSHFYENPDIVEGILRDIISNRQASLNDPRSSRASCQIEENSINEKDHVYTRISQYLDVLENRDTASIRNPSFRSRPRSKHIYVSIIFESSDSVCFPSIDPARDQGFTRLTNNTRDQGFTRPTKSMSRSCPSLSANTESQINTKTKHRPISCYPPKGNFSRLYRNNSHHKEARIHRTNEVSSLFPAHYQNIEESFRFSSPFGNTQNSQAYLNVVYQNLNQVDESQHNTTKLIPPLNHAQSHYENIPCVRDSTGTLEGNGENLNKDQYTIPRSPPITKENPYGVPRSPPVVPEGPYGVPKSPTGSTNQYSGVPRSPSIVPEGHYGVPKSPPVSLNQFFEKIKTNDTNSKHESPAPRNYQDSQNSTGDIQICQRKSTNAKKERLVGNEKHDTLSTYLEKRLEGMNNENMDNRESNGENFGEDDPTHCGTSESRSSDQSESLISGQSENSCNQNSSSPWSYSSTEKKDDHEDVLLVQRTSDCNGNSVCQCIVHKIKVGTRLPSSDYVFGESVA